MSESEIDYEKRTKELTESQAKIIIEILQNYIDKINNMNHYLELEDIITDMVEELREKSIFSGIDGEKYLVVRYVKEIIAYEKEFKQYPIDKDRMSWIIREFHDSQYDCDGFKDGVKNAMRYTDKYYEPSKY